MNPRTSETALAFVEKGPQDGGLPAEFWQRKTIRPFAGEQAIREMQQSPIRKLLYRRWKPAVR